MQYKQGGTRKYPEAIAADRLVELYCEEFKAKYGTEPAIDNARESGYLRPIIYQAGAVDARCAMRQYFKMKNTYYLKVTHSLRVFREDINKILASAAKLRPQTNTRATYLLLDISNNPESYECHKCGKGAAPWTDGSSFFHTECRGDTIVP